MEKNRKFSLEEDFMNLAIDDLIFGFIQYLATYIPEQKLLYVPVAKVTKNKKLMALMIGKGDRTVTRKIEKCIDEGLLIKREITLNDKSIQVYEIPQKTIGRYEILQDSMVWYVVCTRRQYILKIYLYLLNKYKWKQKTGEMYSFTCGELAEAVGYTKLSADNSVVLAVINAALCSLCNEGIIDYVEYYEGKAPRKRLTKVAQSIDELPKSLKKPPFEVIK